MHRRRSESRIERDRDEDEDDRERDDRRELPHKVLDDRVVDRMQGPEQLRRQAAHPHLELEVVGVPAHCQVAHERETDVISREVADVIRADLAALRVRHRDPCSEENHRPDDREQHPEDGLHPVLRSRLDLGHQEGAICADHALTVVCSDVKTRSMTSSIGGSSTEISARRLPRSFTSLPVRSGATCLSTRRVTRPSSRETTVP